MTPEERAAKIIDQYQWDPYAPPYKWLIATEIKAAVKAAVEEERERILKMLEGNAEAARYQAKTEAYANMEKSLTELMQIANRDGAAALRRACELIRARSAELKEQK